jgi:predicted SAM-dependent methyltransferase
MGFEIRMKRLTRFLKYLPKIITWRRHRINGYLFRSSLIKAYIGSHPVSKLHVGAASNILEGWLNSDLKPRSEDVVLLDVSEPFPFEPDSFDYVFSEHLIEHLGYDTGKFMLRECFRVMRSGGRIRIATPDTERLVALLSPDRDPTQMEYIEWISDKFFPEYGKPNRASIVVNNAFRSWGHQFLYDRETLKDVLEKTGFVDIVTFHPGESSDENLRGIENHGFTVGNEEMNRFETMVLEAKRP